MDEQTAQKLGEWLGDKKDVKNAITMNIGKLLLHDIANPAKAVELILATLSGALAGINQTELADQIAEVIPTIQQK